MTEQHTEHADVVMPPETPSVPYFDVPRRLVVPLGLVLGLGFAAIEAALHLTGIMVAVPKLYPGVFMGYSFALFVASVVLVVRMQTKAPDEMRFVRILTYCMMLFLVGTTILAAYRATQYTVLTPEYSAQYYNALAAYTREVAKNLPDLEDKTEALRTAQAFEKQAEMERSNPSNWLQWFLNSFNMPLFVAMITGVMLGVIFRRAGIRAIPPPIVEAPQQASGHKSAKAADPKHHWEQPKA